MKATSTIARGSVTFLTCPYDSEYEIPFPAFGMSGCEGSSASYSRLGSLLADVRRCLSRVFVESTAVFEIRDIRTGEPSVKFGPYDDGTRAYRVARKLGRDWQVFRQETSTDSNLRSCREAVSDTRLRAESEVATAVYIRSDAQ